MEVRAASSHDDVEGRGGGLDRPATFSACGFEKEETWRSGSFSAFQRARLGVYPEARGGDSKRVGVQDSVDGQRKSSAFQSLGFGDW